jgi:LPXTG-motif cell wall-anchored protein
LPQTGGEVFNHALLELGLLTVMVVVLVAALIMLQRQPKREHIPP